MLTKKETGIFKPFLFLIIIVLFALVAEFGFCANTHIGQSVDDTLNYEGVSVDTDPGVNGYWSEPVSTLYTAGWEEIEMRLSIGPITGATVTLQSAYCPDGDCSGATWNDYEDYTETQELVIHDATANMFWRTGVKDNNQGTSSISKIMWKKVK